MRCTKLLGYVLPILLALPICTTYGQEPVDSVQAIIKSETNEYNVTLSAWAKNEGLLHQTLTYLFIARKKDKHNNLSLSKQAGKFTIGPNKNILLSTIKINNSKSNSAKVYLFIRNEKDNILISKDSLILEPEAKTVGKEEKIKLNGMILNETKTKFGQRFYEELYQIYLTSGQPFEFNMKISERPVNGFQTMILVFADDQLVYRFFVSPRNQNLKDHAMACLKTLKNFGQSHQNQTSIKY